MGTFRPVVILDALRDFVLKLVSRIEKESGARPRRVFAARMADWSMRVLLPLGARPTACLLSFWLALKSVRIQLRAGHKIDSKSAQGHPSWSASISSSFGVVVPDDLCPPL